MSSDDQYLFWQTMGATAALLAITIVPILFSRQRVLLERWLVWATLSAAILAAWLLGQPGLITLATLAAVTLITELKVRKRFPINGVFASGFLPFLKEVNASSKRKPVKKISNFFIIILS